MAKRQKEKPLWLRALQDEEAKKWLSKNKQEFPIESFLPDPVCFKDKVVLAREKIASVISDGLPYDNPAQDELARMVLEITPREIAKKLNISRREAYLRIRALKRAAVRKWRIKRERAIMARGHKPRSLPAAPEGIALRTIKFVSGEKEQFAYLVQLSTKERVWLDAAGIRFTKDVQEILNNLEDYKVQFEVLETYGT
jgi:hypothetical protein